MLARLRAPSVGRALAAFFFDAKISDEDRLAASRAVEVWERFTRQAAL